MTQIPRKSTFPSYMVQKLRQKILSDVQEDVIPVSTGIYSYEKLNNKLEAIPKPDIQNYEDKIFFQIIEDRLGVVDKTGEKCNLCDQDYNMKKNPPVMCNFCGFWCCNNCMPLRKRPHPLSKDGSGKRYNVCHRCDTKYLNLQLGHSYVQNRTLLQQAIAKTSQQLQALMSECQQYQQGIKKSKQTFEKNKFKISQLRKEKLQLTKDTKNKMPEQIRLAQDKHQELREKFLSVNLKHKEWMEVNQVKRKARQERERRQKEKQREEERQRILLQKQRLRKEQQQQQKQEMQRRQRQHEKQKQERQHQQMVLRQEQQERQNNRLRMKKITSLQQNSTFNLNLTHSNSQVDSRKYHTNQDDDRGGSLRREESEEEQATRSRKTTKILQSNNQNNQNISKLSTNYQQQAHVPPKQQQQQLSDYFRQSSQHLTLPKYPPQHPEQQPSVNHMHSFNDPATLNNNISTLMYQIQQKTTDYQQNNTSNFSFNSGGIINNYTYAEEEQQNSWKYPLNNNLHRGSNQQQPYTFSNNLTHNQDNDTIQNQPYQIPIRDTSHLQDQTQTNHLSFVDEWYVSKTHPNTTNQQQLSPSKQGSSLSSTLTNNFPKPKPTPQQLQQQCTKSTSQLDEEQLQVARYSLIKAARDSAVEERQRNKIYQKSIYESDQAPYDQEEAEGVGEIKKCQCAIY